MSSAVSPQDDERVVAAVADTSVLIRMASSPTARELLTTVLGPAIGVPDAVYGEVRKIATGTDGKHSSRTIEVARDLRRLIEEDRLLGDLLKPDQAEGGLAAKLAEYLHRENPEGTHRGEAVAGAIAFKRNLTVALDDIGANFAMLGTYEYPVFGSTVRTTDSRGLLMALAVLGDRDLARRAHAAYVEVCSEMHQPTDFDYGKFITVSYDVRDQLPDLSGLGITRQQRHSDRPRLQTASLPPVSDWGWMLNQHGNPEAQRDANLEGGQQRVLGEAMRGLVAGSSTGSAPKNVDVLALSEEHSGGYLIRIRRGGEYLPIFAVIAPVDGALGIVGIATTSRRITDEQFAAGSGAPLRRLLERSAARLLLTSQNRRVETPKQVAGRDASSPSPSSPAAIAALVGRRNEETNVIAAPKEPTLDTSTFEFAEPFGGSLSGSVTFHADADMAARITALSGQVPYPKKTVVLSLLALGASQFIEADRAARPFPEVTPDQSQPQVEAVSNEAVRGAVGRIGQMVERARGLKPREARLLSVVTLVELGLRRAEKDPTLVSEPSPSTERVFRKFAGLPEIDSGVEARPGPLQADAGRVQVVSATTAKL